MAKRWNVHHGNENLGLKTAKEIREALRRGTLDPFDKVSAEGSNIREDLIEVDEIFRESITDEEVEAPPPRIAIKAPQQVMGLGRATPAVPPQATYRGYDPNARDDGPRTNPQPADISPAPSSSWRNDSSIAFHKESDSKESKSTQKRYYLIDKAKILGPLSALEIQSLFNRSVLNQKVKVQRIGGTRSIPVAQFISSFSEDRMKELTEDGKLHQKMSSPSSKVLNELSRVANAQKIAKTRKNKTYLILGMAGLLLGAIIFVIIDSSQSPKRSVSRDETDSRNERKNANRPRLLQRSGNEPIVAETELEAPRVIANRPKPKPLAVNSKPSRVSAVETRDKTRASARAIKKSQPAPFAMQSQTSTSSPSPASSPAPLPPAPAPVVSQTPKTIKAAAPPPVKKVEKEVEKEGPIARAMSSGGRGIQTVGPLNYSLAALESCPSKCTLILRDSAGATLKAVFFKMAYYDQLKKSGGSVFLTGNLRKEGNDLSILIQDVR